MSGILFAGSEDINTEITPSQLEQEHAALVMDTIRLEELKSNFEQTGDIGMAKSSYDAEVANLAAIEEELNLPVAERAAASLVITDIPTSDVNFLFKEYHTEPRPNKSKEFGKLAFLKYFGVPTIMEISAEEGIIGIQIQTEEKVFTAENIEDILDRITTRSNLAHNPDRHETLELFWDEEIRTGTDCFLKGVITIETPPGADSLSVEEKIRELLANPFDPDEPLKLFFKPEIFATVDINDADHLLSNKTVFDYGFPEAPKYTVANTEKQTLEIYKTADPKFLTMGILLAGQYDNVSELYLQKPLEVNV